ncbi:protein disulfide-isomerase A2 [Nothobranchius furzeri]|uniref:Protein disulfide-isomerase n=1 Tax=Nothobranchius furzeri TaxID=105023 RepID=A0A8C6PP76_NOTFU|nr:protein disulfide-isomerase A2 [Nothobranchius furzeri]KAF7223491.1 protein disulfide-isomerase-like [Nothobranchius furzeri]
MRTFKLLLSISLLLWASCIQAEDPEDNTHKHTGTQEDTAGETDEPNAPKKEKTTEIEEEKDVMVLHINNFDRALSENKYLLVEFYAPWCGHCKQLEPVYAEAAEKLKKEEGVMRLAKVDATEEKELAEEFAVGSFPTLKLFIDGNREQPVDFTSKRTVEGIIQWMKRRTGPGAVDLISGADAVQFIEAHNITLVGFFDSLDSEEAKLLKELAFDLTDTEFAVTATSEVLQTLEAKPNSVVLFKKFDERRADFEWPENEKLDKENLTAFIKENSLELIIPFSQETADKIFTSRILLHTLLFINSTVKSQVELVEKSKVIAKEFRGKMLFVSIDVTAALSHVLKYFGVSESDAPTARIINMETQKKFSIPSGDLNENSLRQLCQEVVEGNAKPYFRSEEIPEDWNKGPVKVLVGKNFKSVALDPTKNVFVEFYAPWCGHCKELEPIWEKLGEKYADNENIIIAKMDATANEVESVVVSGFPTLKYFPAEDKEVISYTGKRDLETFSKFLDSGGVLPEEDSNEDENEEDDEEEEEEDKTDDQKKEVDESPDIASNETKDEL